MVEAIFFVAQPILEPWVSLKLSPQALRYTVAYKVTIGLPAQSQLSNGAILRFYVTIWLPFAPMDVII